LIKIKFIKNNMNDLKRGTTVEVLILQKQKRMEEILTSCEDQKRSRTKEETAEWRMLRDEVQELKEELLEIKQHQEKMARGAKPVPGGSYQSTFTTDDTEPFEERSFQILKKVEDDPKKPISQWVERNYEVSDASRRANPFDVIVALGSGKANNQRTEAAMREVRSASGGSNLLDSYLSAVVLEVMLEKSHLAKAGMKIMPMLADTHKFGRISDYPSFSWLAAGATQSEQSLTFDAVSLSAKTLRSWTRVDREFLQSAVNASQVLQRAFSQSGANEIDRCGLEGSGTGQEPSGVATISGVSSYSMGTNGAAMTNYDPFIEISKVILEANGSIPNTAIMAPSRWATINKLKEATTNAPLARPEAIKDWSFLETAKINTARTQGSSSVASNVYVGNFDLLTLGVRLNLEVGFVNTDAATNSVDILAAFRGDFATEYAPGLGKIIGVL
jgi:HK97 family phage major capsid protein